MIEGKKVLAMIPARAGSKGLPQKNSMNFCGKPLIAWSIEQALACSEVDSVLVSTDCPFIAELSLTYGAKVPFIRPSELATDTATSSDVILHALDFLEKRGDFFDVIVLLEPTSPLREVSDISGALKTLVDNPSLQSVVGVCPVKSQHPSFLFRVGQGHLKPYLEKNPNDLRRQEVEDLYFLEGTIYASYVGAFKEKKGFYHEATGPWRVEPYKSIEIDEGVDLIVAEALVSARDKGKI